MMGHNEHIRLQVVPRLLADKALRLLFNIAGQQDGAVAA